MLQGGVAEWLHVGDHQPVCKVKSSNLFRLTLTHPALHTQHPALSHPAMTSPQFVDVPTEFFWWSQHAQSMGNPLTHVLPSIAEGQLKALAAEPIKTYELSDGLSVSFIVLTAPKGYGAMRQQLRGCNLGHVSLHAVRDPENGYTKQPLLQGVRRSIFDALKQWACDHQAGIADRAVESVLVEEDEEAPAKPKLLRPAVVSHHPMVRSIKKEPEERPTKVLRREN
jgi:hypothetical protein